MRLLGRLFAWLALALGLAALAAHFLTPWPSVLAIRAVFDAGARDASVALERHLPANVSITQTLEYAPGLSLDIIRPPAVDPARPTIVWIHGGGFVSGQRQDLTNYLKVLAGQGFTIVNLDYTIAPEASHPTPVRQVAQALAFLDREGARLGINRAALVLAGDSAGAQIAAQTANIITSPAYAAAVGIAAPIAPNQLAGALLHCGLFDIDTLGEGKGGVLGWFVRTTTWAYSGHRNWRDAPGFELISVARHVTPAFPPTFIGAGNADPLEPQSRTMADALTRAGVPVTRLFWPADHPTSLGHEYQFNLDLPEGQQALRVSVAWLEGLAR